MAGLFIRRNQLQWLALLVVAVALPTASLLWFMSRVIANERLVVRQKLSALYQDKLADATARTESLYTSWLKNMETTKAGENPYALFRRLVLEDNLQGQVVWDEDGSLIYPRAVDVLGNDVTHDNPLGDAWQLEFSKRQFAEAARAYGELAGHSDSEVAVAAVTGRARCLSKLGKLDEAIQVCEQAALRPAAEVENLATRSAVENARLLLLSLLKQAGPSQANTSIFHRTVSALMNDVFNTEDSHARLPANQNLFLAQKVLEAMEGPFAINDTKAKSQLQKLVAAESLSIAAAETMLPSAGPLDTFFKARLGEMDVFGLRHRTSHSTALVLFAEDGLAPVLSGYSAAFGGSEAVYRIIDPAGNFIAGTPEPQGLPFTVAPLPQGFPGWKAELYFVGGDIFEKAANRQVAFYAWTGFLVILLILIVGAIATRAIGRQIRLNEMKNDFIATVSHELKTPLASMRVLVDTLLEGNVKDEAQVRKYLQLTAKENERLSRMIDNFLTFSRMERNKVAFTLTDAGPEAIARDAIEAVQTKYEAQHCHLTTDIAPKLPVIQADHDALVTVLVNLLDNACKYTGENKQVSLKIAAGGDTVSFAVEDNGIGLARRHVRRIFDRFYQVDSSLARKAEGCGLGLSIVKFIVDAHKGKIIVDSKPGRGSTFTVRVPIGRSNAD